MNAADIPGVALRPAMESLARTPAYVCAAFDAATADQLLLRAVDGAFSLTEHACHLRDLAREGQFDGRRIALADLVAMVVDHDREHRQEIEALLAALELYPWK